MLNVLYLFYSKLLNLPLLILHSVPDAGINLRAIAEQALSQLPVLYASNSVKFMYVLGFARARIRINILPIL
jgi:hypothetical protein